MKALVNKFRPPWKFTTMMIQLIQKLLSKSNILIQKLLSKSYKTVSLGNVADKLLDTHYQGLTPSEVIHSIHHQWTLPKMEFIFQITYCGKLLEKKEYEKLKYLVPAEMEFFVPCLMINLSTIESFMVSERMTMHTVTSIVLIMIIFHILSTSAIVESPIMMNQLIQELLSKSKTTVYLGKAADKYINMYYQELTPSESIHTIHYVWKSCPQIEFALQMTYCGILLEKKEYKKLKYLVSNEMKFFVSCLVINSDIIKSFMLYDMTMSIVTFTVMFYVLHCSLSSNPRPDIGETIGSIVSYIQINSSKNLYSNSIYEGFYGYLLLLDKDQMPCTKPLINQLLHAEEPNQGCTISAIIKASVVKLMENNYHGRSKSFLRQNLEYLKDVSIDTSDLDCTTRREYSLILLEVLHECSLSEDTYGTHLAVAAINSLKVSLFDKSMAECYCYMGSEKCVLQSYNDYMYSKQMFGDPIFGLKKLKRKYKNLYWGEKESFVRLLKKWNGKLNTCTKKRQHDGDDDYMYHIDILDDYDYSYLDNAIYDDMHWDYEESFLYKILVLLGHVADDCTEAKEMKEFVQTLCRIELNPELEDLCIEVIINSVYIKLSQHNNIAQFVLDIIKGIPECPLLTKLTLTLGESLHFDEQVIKDKKKVVYKCFCKVRHAVNNGDLKDINIDKYREHFTFIRSMEKEEEMEKLVKFSEFLIIVMLLLKGSTYGGHHKSAEMKKYLSLKYEYDKAILYLLWCSGDVEINPGPTLKKLKTIPASQKLRAWIWDMCSILLKILKGIPVNSKPKDLWKDKPDNWPCDQPFYDPRNKKKGHNEDVKSDKNLLKCILDLCYEHKLDISQYQREITAWRADDKKLLFELHTCRKEIQTINTAIKCLINVKDTAELQHMLGHIKIQIDFSVHNVNNEKQKGSTDIIRHVAVLFCKISKGSHPLEKIDRIWTTKPIGWNKERKYYDPNNAEKRTEKGQDKNLVNNLLEYIETHNKYIPLEYTALVTAWKQQNMQVVCKIYTIHTNVAVIENSLKYLQLEGLLEKPHILDKLKHNGLTLYTEWSHGSIASSGICDNNQASISQSTNVNQSNAQQNSAGLDSKGQNGSQFGPTDNLIHAPSNWKRSNKTSVVQEAEGKCQNKKRKLPHDENTKMKKTRRKISSNYVLLHIRQTSCTAGSSPDNTSPDGALQVNNSMDFLFATAVNLPKNENSVPHNTTVPYTESDTQYTLQTSDHHRIQPIPGIDSLLQELDQNYGSVESQMEQPGDIVTQDIHTISVPTEGQSDGIVAHDIHTISVPTEGQSDGIVAHDNHTISVPTKGQSDGIVAQDNHTISVPTKGQSDGTVAQDSQTISVPTEKQSDGKVVQDSETIALPSGEQSGDVVYQNNMKTDVKPEEQADDTVTWDNHTISVPIGEQHDAIDCQDNKTTFKSTDTQTDLEPSENPENDELLNKIFACHPVESMKCDDLDSQLIKDSNQLVWWINDKNSNV